MGNDATMGLVLKESSIFDRSKPGRTGFQLPNPSVLRKRPSRFARAQPAELPEVSELDVVRHFTRLSSWNYSIDAGVFPLGSCTMKYNPRINEEIASLKGFTDVHPAFPAEFCQGSLALIHRLELALAAIAGMDCVSLEPAAGAQGEFTGLSVIRTFFEKHGSDRKIVLIPDTAHGTNPASCTLAGYVTEPVRSSASGILSKDSIASALSKHGRNVAALMMTNPNTLGFFESHILEIAELLHESGAQLYMDGANMNALMGVARPGDMGVDVMQFNLHKTFSTPHGGGGPGSGPIAVKSHLGPFLPSPRVVRAGNGEFELAYPPESIGKVKGSLGNFGVLVRALTYILHHGSAGLKRVSRVAVLNANYVKHRLSEFYALPHNTPSFHEVVFNDSRQNKYHVKTLQIAKALIDHGFHPPTIYFPLVVPGALLIEPTETESITDLDKLVDAFIEIARSIKEGEKFENAPTKPIVGKVDEVRAARTPILTLDDRV